MAKCLQNGHRSAILGSEKKYFCTTSLYNKMNSHLKIFSVTIGDIHVKSDRQTGCNPIPVVPLREPQGTKNKRLWKTKIKRNVRYKLVLYH